MNIVDIIYCLKDYEVSTHPYRKCIIKNLAYGDRRGIRCYDIRCYDCTYCNYFISKYAR